jgi:hypothetical protein
MDELTSILSPFHPPTLPYPSFLIPSFQPEKHQMYLIHPPPQMDLTAEYYTGQYRFEPYKVPGHKFT